VAGGGQRAFIYDNGSMTDLNSLIGAGSGWYLWWADDINDSGQIIGTGWHYGQQHAFLLTPAAVPVPAAIWLFGSGLLGLLGIALRRKETNR
jgi:probable HAF family extracellular repeat protein